MTSLEAGHSWRDYVSSPASLPFRPDPTGCIMACSGLSWSSQSRFQAIIVYLVTKFDGLSRNHAAVFSATNAVVARL